MILQTLFFFEMNFYWSMSASQCCFSFRSAGEWIIGTYTCIPLACLSIQVTIEHWVEFSVLQWVLITPLKYHLFSTWYPQCIDANPNLSGHPRPIFPPLYPCALCLCLYLYAALESRSSEQRVSMLGFVVQKQKCYFSVCIEFLR